jgi:hypothetical protein
MSRLLFNSPQKKWVRQFFWLPAIEDFKARSNQALKYLTFAGPEGYDIDFFTQDGAFKLENIRVWERSDDAARALQAKYGLGFQVKTGEAFDLSKAKDERRYFPHNVINLDFTNGAFQLSRARYVPHKFELISNIMDAQREHTESFVLLLAFAATADVDSDHGKTFVQKIAFGLATRFGHTEPLFNLTRDPAGTYPQTLAAVIPCAVIRLSGEHFYDAQCLGKALYFPYGLKKTGMICFVFYLTYDNPALSETNLQSCRRMDNIVLRRQEESLAVPVADVNKLVRKRSSQRGVLKLVPA